MDRDIQLKENQISEQKSIVSQKKQALKYEEESLIRRHDLLDVVLIKSKKSLIKSLRKELLKEERKLERILETEELI